MLMRKPTLPELVPFKQELEGNIHLKLKKKGNDNPTQTELEDEFLQEFEALQLQEKQNLKIYSQQCAALGIRPIDFESVRNGMFFLTLCFYFNS